MLILSGVLYMDNQEPVAVHVKLSIFILQNITENSKTILIMLNKTIMTSTRLGGGGGGGKVVSHQYQTLSLSFRQVREVYNAYFLNNTLSEDNFTMNKIFSIRTSIFIMS
jgi:hypothetical protein